MAISGQKTVTAAGTAVQLGSGACAVNLMIKALATNTGLVFVGNDGADVTSATGQELDAGEYLVIEGCARFDQIYIDSAINGDGVSWILLEV
jgi:hypothetical protein